MVLPPLPGKIQGQSETELNKRQAELEEYMSKMLQLVGVCDNFNQIIVNYIQYVPYNQLNELSNSVY